MTSEDFVRARQTVTARGVGFGVAVSAGRMVGEGHSVGDVVVVTTGIDGRVGAGRLACPEWHETRSRVMTTATTVLVSPSRAIAINGCNRRTGVEVHRPQANGKMGAHGVGLEPCVRY